MIVTALVKKRFNILKKFRQAGCTTIVAAFALWLCLFQPLKTVVILSKGDVEATEVLDRIKVMYEELPKWIKLMMPVTEKNKHVFQFKNRSIIKSRSSGRESGRGLSGSLVIFDEAAFIESIDTIWKAAYPTVSTGGSVFVLSTVNGIGNWYHQTWENAIVGANYFNALDINYEQHPEYVRNDEWEEHYIKTRGKSFYQELEDKGIDIDKWVEVTKANIGPKAWKQEYEGSFLGTGDTYIEGEVLSQLYEAVDDEYWCNYSQRMRLWKEPDPSHDYLISVDPSLGRERDSTVFLVFNVYNGELVAEFKSPNTPLNQCCRILVDVAHKYNNAMIIPERNSIGTNLIENLIEMGYDYIWADDKGTLGFQTNTTSRDVALAIMEEFVRTRKVKIPSKRIIEELLTFIINDQGKFEADEGCHDDMVMALAIACVGLKDLVSGSPIESRIGDSYKSQDSAFSKNYTISLGSNGQEIEEEDYRWLLQD